MTQTKKLPRYMRRLNLIYKILMIGMAVVNTGLIMLNWGTTVYYEVFSAISTLLIVIEVSNTRRKSRNAIKKSS